MYRIDRNNFFIKPKKSTIYTPKEVSEFIFQILHPFFNKKSLVLDIGSGLGSLSEP
jgi:type I restriction-modification system DNA methylase subunit